jgi:hypothetical protein
MTREWRVEADVLTDVVEDSRQQGDALSDYLAEHHLEQCMVFNHFVHGSCSIVGEFELRAETAGRAVDLAVSKIRRACRAIGVSASIVIEAVVTPRESGTGGASD